MNNRGNNQAVERLLQHGLHIQSTDTTSLAPAWLVYIPAQDWTHSAQLAAECGLRWAGLWAEQFKEHYAVFAILEWRGDYVVLRTNVGSVGEISISSQTPFFPGAARLERHTHDMFGIDFDNHPDPRRWTRHQAWPDGCYPLRLDFPVAGLKPGRTAADNHYPFVQILGSGVCEIPVGPVHAGIIEPGHFRFQAVGEDVLSLEERLGYVHKGIEKIAVGRTPQELSRLAGRVSGDSTVAHTWAACQALERACSSVPPPRALFLRALMAERERIANHLGDIGAICNDVGFSFIHIQCGQLRELWQRRNLELFGHRLLMDRVIPGGVAHDIDDTALAQSHTDLNTLRLAMVPLFNIIEDQPSLEDRLIDTGRLSVNDCLALGCTGFVGKASGQKFDVRHDCAYPPYDQLTVNVPVTEKGDVAARVWIRMKEIHNSLDIMDQILQKLPAGEIIAPLHTITDGTAGLGIIDGWRGEIISYVRLDAAGLVTRFFPRDPSWFTWPALEKLIHGNIVPDFPVCNKSVNGSYSGHDL